FGIDDPAFVNHMCSFLGAHSTEMEAFFESRPGSTFDLESKPKARAAYKCIVALAAPSPSWAAPASAQAVTLKMVASPPPGAAPPVVPLRTQAKLTAPTVQWQPVFGDGTQSSGAGPPPATVPHQYTADGTYEATLFVYANPPFDPTTGPFLTSAAVTVG